MKQTGGGGSGANAHAPEHTSYIYKMKIYSEDGYINLSELSAEQKDQFKFILLDTLRIGSVIDPINCPVRGLRVDWSNERVIITVRLDTQPSIEPRQHCTKKSLASYINMQTLDVDEYVLELIS